MTRHAPYRVLALVLLGAMLPLLSSCSGGGHHASSPTADALARGRAVWASRNVSNYRFTVRVVCFCPEIRNVVIEVRNGVVVSRTYEDDGTPVDSEFLAQYDTVEKLFAVIQEAVDQKAVRLDAMYDPTFGYPKEAFIDISEQIADEEIGLSVRSFAVIP